MEIKYISINQKRNLLTIGKLNGYLIISLETNKILTQRNTLEPIYIIELYYCSNIICIIGDGKPLNTLNIWDDNLQKYIGNINNTNIIKSIKVNRNYILIYDEFEIKLFNFNKLELKKTINYKNNKCFDLSLHYHNYLVTSNSKGYITLYNIDEDKQIYFKGHENNIQYLKISRMTKYIASVSEDGKKIKLFDLHTNRLIKVLYRGLISSSIICIEFDITDKYILVYSDTGTIHIYSILDDNSSSVMNNISNYMFNYKINDYNYSLYRLELNKIFNLCVINNHEEIYVIDKEVCVTKYKLKNKKYSIN